MSAITQSHFDYLQLCSSDEKPYKHLRHSTLHPLRMTHDCNRGEHSGGIIDDIIINDIIINTELSDVKCNTN